MLLFSGYVIIGTGKDKYELETSVYERFNKKGIKVDVLPTVKFSRKWEF